MHYCIHYRYIMYALIMNCRTSDRYQSWITIPTNLHDIWTALPNVNVSNAKTPCYKYSMVGALTELGMSGKKWESIYKKWMRKEDDNVALKLLSSYGLGSGVRSKTELSKYGACTDACMNTQDLCFM